LAIARGAVKIITLCDMEEFFTNDYVVEVESGHPGYTDYKLIATPESWRTLAAELVNAAEKPGGADESKRNERGELLLLSKYATISKGKTSRVSISFYAAKDLTAHHVPSSRFDRFYNSTVGCWLMFLVAAGILYLAAVGASALLSVS